MKWMATYINSKLPKGSKELTADDFKTTFTRKQVVVKIEAAPDDPIQYATKESIANQKTFISGDATKATRKTRRRSEVPYRDKK